MTMIYDLQEGARHIKAMRGNKSNGVTKVLNQYVFSDQDPNSKEQKAKRNNLKRQNDERIRKIEDNYIAKQNKMRAEYNRKGYDIDGNLSPDHKFWKLKQFGDAASKIDTGSVVGYKRRSVNRDHSYQDSTPNMISRNNSNHIKYSENADLMNKNILAPPITQKGSHTLHKPSRNYDKYNQDTMFLPPNHQSLQYGNPQQQPNTQSRRQIVVSNNLRLSKASLQALDLQLKNQKTPFKKNAHLQEADDENIFNLVGQNNEMNIKSRESFYGLQSKLKPQIQGRNHIDERQKNYYTPAPNRGVTMQDRYNSINDGVIQMQRQKQNKSSLGNHGQQYDIPQVAPRLERNYGHENHNPHGIQLMQSYSQDQITPYLQSKRVSNKNNYRALQMVPSEEKYYDPVQMAKKSKNNRNFLKENFQHVVFVQNQDAKRMRQERNRSDMKENMRSLDVNKNFAKVPDYIQKYNQQKEDFKTNLVIQEEYEKIPYGHRIVSEQERLETLKNLEDAQNEIVTTLERLPILSHAVKRSPQLESQRINMEQKLIKVKNAIQTFRRPPVYLALS